MFENMFKGKNPLDRELEKSKIDHDNKLFLVYVIAGLFIAMLVMNPLAVIIGIILFLKKKLNKGIIIATAFIIIGTLLTLTYSYMSGEGFYIVLKNYLLNFYNLKEGQTLLTFFKGYFINPFFILFIGMGIGVGLYMSYWYQSTNNEEEARSKSKRRYDDEGNPTSFFKDFTREKVKDAILPDKFKVPFTHTNVEGTCIGKSGVSNISITDIEARGHGMIVGTTGFGKTTTLLNFVESCAERFLSMVFVNGKWDDELASQMESLTRKYGRKFYHFDIRGVISDTCYNPLKIGNMDNLKEKLIDISDWSEEHYKANAERVLMLIIRVIEQLEKEIKPLTEEQIKEKLTIDRSGQTLNIKRDIVCIQQLLNHGTLGNAIEAIEDDELRNELDSIYTRLNPDWYGGMESRLALIAESGLRNLVKDTINGIDLTKVFEEKAIVLFSLDSMQNSTTTRIMGRLIVKDINTCATLRKDKKTPAYTIYDEHGAYISTDVDSQFAMARSCGIRTITSSQNVADYQKTAMGDILMKKVIGNTNFKLILMQNEPGDANYLAETIGTARTTNRTISTDYNNQYKGSGLQDVEEFDVHPNVIKNLKIGEAVLIKKVPEKEVIKDIKVRMVNFDGNIQIKKEKPINKKSEIKKVTKGKGRRDPLARRNKRLEKNE